MGLFNKDIKTFDDLLLHGLQDIYYAEQQIVKALPKLIEKATNQDLTKGLKEHLEETKNQITRLDQAFRKLGQTVRRSKSFMPNGIERSFKRVSSFAARSPIPFVISSIPPATFSDAARDPLHPCFSRAQDTATDLALRKSPAARLDIPWQPSA